MGQVKPIRVGVQLHPRFASLKYARTRMPFLPDISDNPWNHECPKEVRKKRGQDIALARKVMKSSFLS